MQYTILLHPFYSRNCHWLQVQPAPAPRGPAATLLYYASGCPLKGPDPTLLLLTCNPSSLYTTTPAYLLELLLQVQAALP
jgi:hypothetical protein